MDFSENGNLVPLEIPNDYASIGSPHQLSSKNTSNNTRLSKKSLSITRAIKKYRRKYRNLDKSKINNNNSLHTRECCNSKQNLNLNLNQNQNKNENALPTNHSPLSKSRKNSKFLSNSSLNSKQNRSIEFDSKKNKKFYK